MQNTDQTDQHDALYNNIALLDGILCKVLEKKLGKKLLDIITALVTEAKTFPDSLALVSLALSPTPTLSPTSILSPTPILSTTPTSIPSPTPSPTPSLFENLWHTLQQLNSEDLLSVTRALTQFLNLTSIAEQHHRIRRRRWHQVTNHPPQPGSLEAVIPSLCDKFSKETVLKTLSTLNINLVLTAHPTEVTRRTFIHKYNEIAKMLASLDQENLTPRERQRILDRLHEVITAASASEEIRHQKPSAIEEARWGFAVVEESLWQAIPEFLRDLESCLQENVGESLPLEVMPIRFASWMGGDRDGNPNVTSEVTRHVILLARWMAADLFYRDISLLQEDLSLQNANSELHRLVGDTREPYRVLLREVKSKLKRTKFWAECQIEQREVCPTPDLIYLETQDLLDPLLVCYRSLQSIGAEAVAKGRLLDVIRRVTCFGLTLLPIDIRQHAEKHAELMNALTEALQLGSYLMWSEEEKQSFLRKALQERDYFQPKKASISTDYQDYLDTFRVIADHSSESFGAYVISMASKPSDVLLVLVLQLAMGVVRPLRIVPLFETQPDLMNAAACVEQLFLIEEYKKVCYDKHNKDSIQEIMIGYSDSAKDAGVLSASWAQYQAQEAIVEVGKRHGIRIVFFHGRGGSVGRGGGPSHLAIRSLPPGSIQGALRVTQQGEVIRHRFGLQQIAERSLAIYTTATLEATLEPDIIPPTAFRQRMDQLSQVSMECYQKYVKESSEFVRYFSEVTPIRELDKIAIASRPSHRNKNPTIENLRAIPWMFAWTQNRFILPAWLGVGEALMSCNGETNWPEKVLEKLEKKETFLNKMYRDWNYFSSVLSAVEMALGKVSATIAFEYERCLAEDDLRTLGDALRTSLATTEKNLLSILEESQLLEKNPVLRRSIAVRNPYLLVLHLLQIELLARTREQPETVDEHLESALLVSIAGIAAGMNNTG